MIGSGGEEAQEDVQVRQRRCGISGLHVLLSPFRLERERGAEPFVEEPILRASGDGYVLRPLEECTSIVLELQWH